MDKLVFFVIEISRQPGERRMGGWRNLVGRLLFTTTLVCAPSSAPFAEPIEAALARAYRDNPQLNAQRASVRSTDENVPQALSGYRPKVAASGTAGEQKTTMTEVTKIPGQPNIYTTLDQTVGTNSYGITASQTLFNGFQTANRTRTAESQVFAAREGLRVMEQTVLLNAATVYTDVLRDTANVQIQQSNVAALRKVLEDTKKRFSVADVTATDVSQALAQLAAAESALLAAESTLSTSKANYQTIIGIPPKDLKPGAPVDRFVPGTLEAAIEAGGSQNPNVTAAMYGVDVAYLQVKIAEGSLYPTAALQGSVQQANDPAVGIVHQYSAGIIAQLTIPLYQGGNEYSLVRQQKENLGQQRLNLDLVRRQVEAAVKQAWAQVQASKGQLQKAQVQVTAAEAALSGVRREVVVGERTTFDLLQAQQVLVNARITLITAQHDRIVASYSLVAAVGRLSPTVLKLPTEIYDPQVHYQQVRDNWVGVRTPTGN
jgi:outer membrane protein